MEESLSFGYWVRRRRKALDLTQVELGKRVGASGAMIRKIEADERRPSRQLAELLALELAVPEDELDLFIQVARDIAGVDKLAISPHPVSEPEPSTLTRNNLPAPMTSMVNRVSELAAIKSLLLRKDVRLVTITGPPGIGKTRLSIQTAEKMLPVFADGVWFIDLSDISDPELVMPIIAVTLGLSAQAGLSSSQNSMMLLRDKQMLLVLDNLEQVVEGIARDIANLLRACRDVKILATSRIRIDIYGEHEYVLPPMSVPPSSGEFLLEDLINYEAVQLFVTRTRQHQPQFEITAQNAASVAEICQHLDGMPLALELAAARLREMPADVLADALRQASGQNWLSLLRWTARDLPPRQRTLLNAIAWSYTLLAPAQQVVLCQLSVFSGSFDWPAVEAVVDLPSLMGETDLRSTLDQLVDHNLVSLVSQVPERWHLLEMIREFTRAEIDPMEARQVSQRHANYYLTRLTNLAVDSATPDYLDEIFHEANNGRAALNFAIGAADANLAQRLAFAMGGYWEYTGLLAEGSRYLEAVFNIPGSVDDDLRISNLHRATNLDWMQHNFDSADTHISSALELARRRQDTRIIVELINLQARIYLEQGRYQQADFALMEGLQLELSLPKQNTTPFMLVQQGEAALALGDLDRAEVLTREGLDSLRSRFFIPYCVGWTNLAEIAIARGDSQSAHYALLQAMPFVHLHNRRERFFLNALAGLLLCDRDSPDQAVDMAGRIFSYLEIANDRLGDPLSPIAQQQIKERTERARNLSSESSWQKVWEQGKRWTAAEALAVAKNILSKDV